MSLSFTIKSPVTLAKLSILSSTRLLIYRILIIHAQKRYYEDEVIVHTHTFIYAGICYFLLHFVDTVSFMGTLCHANLSAQFFFFSSICSLSVFLSQFGNTCSISDVFIIVFVMVICE